MASPSVAVYARISEDAEGVGLGVQRQERDCRQLCQARGWAVAGVFVDNDTSAYKRKTRPEFDRMVQLLRTGAADGVVVYNLDRLCRRLRDLEPILEVYEDCWASRRRKLLFASIEMDIDLATSDGRLVARMLTSVATKASEDTARRVRDWHRHKATLGELSGGGWRPFGWQKDRITLEPAEAALLRHAADDVLAGVPLATIARMWTAAHVATSRGGGRRWSGHTLKLILLSPRMVGWRCYRGEVAVDIEGRPVRGPQQPVLDEETWRNLRIRLASGAKSRPAQKYLLSGLARCGRCGTSLSGNWRANRGKHNYTCPSPGSGSGCGGNSVVGPWLDGLVQEALVAHLANQETGPMVACVGWDGADEHAELAGRLEALVAAYADPRARLGPGAAQTMQRLEGRLRELEVERDRHAAGGGRRLDEPRAVVRRWPTMAMEERRVYLVGLIEAVVVQRTGRGRRKTPEDVQIVWRQPTPT